MTTWYKEPSYVVLGTVYVTQYYWPYLHLFLQFCSVSHYTIPEKSLVLDIG